MSDNDRCNEVVYKNGTGVAVLQGSRVRMEIIVGWAREDLDMREDELDWHYVGGRACVVAVRDHNRVARWFQISMPRVLFIPR